MPVCNLDINGGKKMDPCQISRHKGAWQGGLSKSGHDRCSVNVPGKRWGSTKGAEYILIRGLGQ